MGVAVGVMAADSSEDSDVSVVSSDSEVSSEFSPVSAVSSAGVGVGVELPPVISEMFTLERENAASSISG